MSYIRGALPFLIYNPNTRDDIVPDGISSTFELSQEVPGGYENNVEVVRRELKYDQLIQSCELISFDNATSKISCSNAAVAAALSILEAGEILNVDGAANSGNNDDFLITQVSYDGSLIEITVEGTLTTESVGASITLIRKFVGSWEVLEPGIDYTISGIDAQYNKLINLSKIPQEQDVLYVKHRGEATYNFVPTEKSVGPDQLQDNLRNFVVDIFTGDGSEDTFALSQFAVSPRTIEVSIDGTIQYGSDTDLSFTGQFDLALDGLSITFATPPPNSSKIYVRHLGFSTVSRRQALSPSQIGSIAPGAVGVLELANGAVTEPKIADGAVSTSKIQAFAVDDTKLLPRNNQYLNWAGSVPFTQIGVLKLDASNAVTLRSAGGSLSFNVADTRMIQFTTSAILDSSGTGVIDLGASGNKFKDGYLSGQLNVATISATGDIHTDSNVTIDGNITVGGTIDSVDISSLQAQVTALSALVSQNETAGMIKFWAKDAAAPTGFLLCDGSLYSTTTYAALFAVIAYTFGGSGPSFAVPDFRGRIAIGKDTSGVASGFGSPAGRFGSIDHTHTTPNHTHGLANHVHLVPAHYHAVAASSTLNITSSGTHFTNIDISHSHSSSAVSGTIGGVSDTTSNHSHTLSVTSNIGSHTHTVTIGLAGGHGHQVNAMGRSSGNTSTNPLSWGTAPDDGELALIKGGNGAFDLSNGAFAVGDHSHTTTVGTESASHTHNIVAVGGGDGRHGHSFSLNASGQTLGSTIKSDSGGTHIHPVGNFAGAIGEVGTGADGNSAFSSGVASPNVSDSGGASNTGNANPPCQTVHFIIKT